MPARRKPLLDALLNTDWSHRFESFTVKETRMLEVFNDLMWDTTGWSFFQEPTKFHLHASPGRFEQTLDYAGSEALRAAADEFRQLWMDGEPANHGAVSGALHRRVSGRPQRSTREMLRGCGLAYRNASREILMWTGVPEGQIAREGVGVPIRAHQVVDDWMNGIKAHRDPVKRERVLAWSPVAYEFSLIKAMHAYVDAMLLTHVVVRGALGVLDEDRRPLARAG